MTLRIDTFPNPAAGKDFSLLVPGDELWDVVGVFAQLTTTNALLNAVDLSGNGHTGGYSTSSGAGYPKSVPGPIVGGHMGVAVADGISNLGTFAAGNVLDLSGDFTAEFWLQLTGHPGFSYVVEVGRGIGVTADVDVLIAGDGHISLQLSTPFSHGFFTGPNATLADGNWHQVAVVYQPAGPTATAYVDGVAIVMTLGSAGPALPAENYSVFIGLYQGGQQNIGGNYAHLAEWPSALSGATIAAHYAARATLAGYEAAVLASAPAAYWPLDDGTGLGRTPSLVVTDGTHVVQSIGQGFSAPTSVSPYSYSWQPGVSANTVTPAGTAISIAIPKLVLPPGYVVKSVTPDIKPADQWSNIAVWWSTDVMDALGLVNPYAYPPGAKLEYHQQGT